MNFECLAYFLDCELVAVSLLRGKFAGLSFDSVGIYSYLPGSWPASVGVLRCVCNFGFDSRGAVYFLEGAPTGTTCTSKRDN